MKVNKKNGDPPKGYTRDADGYLTPVGFNEFHEEGDGPRGLSTDAFLAGITAAESSSFPRNNYDRYQSEIAPSVWNSLGLTEDDFMAGFHFAGYGRFRDYRADLREGRLTAQEFLDKKPTSGNMTMGEYLDRFRDASGSYRD